jgi:hypothetical protein
MTLLRALSLAALLSCAACEARPASTRAPISQDEKTRPPEAASSTAIERPAPAAPDGCLLNLGISSANVSAFWRDVKGALKKRNLSRVDDLSELPLRVNHEGVPANRAGVPCSPDVRRCDGPHALIERADLRGNFAKIFPSELLAQIESSPAEETFCNYQGTMLGRGQLWATVNAAGQLKLNVVNGPIPAPKPQRKEQGSAAPVAPR